jgi:transposase-like protein
MGRGTNLSEATKAEILRLSCEGKSGAEIGRVLGIHRATVSAFLIRYGRQNIRSCEYCGKAIKDGEAVFCPYCGKKILTDRDRLEAHLAEIRKAACEFPSTQRDVIFKAIAEVSKIAKKMEAGK